MFDIIIPHYGSQELLDRCVKSIQNNTIFQYQLIVVDNNQHNVGFAKAVNKGVAQGNNDYIVILNNDTIVPVNWLERMVKVFTQDSGIGIIGPLSTAPTQWQGIDNVSKWLQRSLPAPEYLSNNIRPFPSRLAFWCVVIPRFVWRKVGDLDEQFFMYAEDEDWCLRATKMGYASALDLGTVVYHRHRANYDEQAQQHHQESREKFKNKWGDEAKPHGWS